MKANKAITIALAGVLTACAIPFGTVFAAAEGDAQDVYPQDFDRTLEIEALTDYAVYGDSFAYASNSTITIISRDASGDRKRTSYTHEYLVNALDYDDSGKLYFKTSSEISYLYGSPVTQEEHNFQGTKLSIINLSDAVFYTLNNEGTLTYWKGGDDKIVGDGYSLIKRYGETVYAIKDGTVPYVVDGQTATALDLSYTDFSGADNISCTDAAQKLKADGYQVKTANLTHGSYYTQVDADAIGKENTFTQIRTQKAEGNKPCIVLCTSGNASVVATNDGMFITATANVKDSAYTSPKNDWPLNAEGTKRLEAYATEKTGVYASPFMSDSTRIEELESGAENHVEVIEKFELDYINTKFYKIRYDKVIKDENGEPVIDEQTGKPKTKTVSGYVAANILTKYDFKAEDNKPHENGDKEFGYDTNVVSVVLAIVIVALVIIAVMYISLAGSKNKNTDKKKKKQKREKVRDYDEEDED